MPPSVARVAVDTAGGKKKPCGLRNALSWSSTTPGSTVTRARVEVERRDAVQVARQVEHGALGQRLAVGAGAAAARRQREVGHGAGGAHGGVHVGAARGCSTAAGMTW